MADDANKIKVTILTGTYRIKGTIEVVAGGRRVTDYLAHSSEFITVVDAEVWETSGRQVFALPVINVHRDHVQIMAPTL